MRYTSILLAVAGICFSSLMIGCVNPPSEPLGQRRDALNQPDQPPEEEPPPDGDFTEEEPPPEDQLTEEEEPPPEDM